MSVLFFTFVLFGFVYLVWNQKKFTNTKWTAWPKFWNHCPVGLLCLWAPHREVLCPWLSSPWAYRLPWASPLISLCVTFSHLELACPWGLGLGWDWVTFPGDARKWVGNGVLCLNHLIHFSFIHPGCQLKSNSETKARLSSCLMLHLL